MWCEAVASACRHRCALRVSVSYRLQLCAAAREGAALLVVGEDCAVGGARQRVHVWVPAQDVPVTCERATSSVIGAVASEQGAMREWERARLSGGRVECWRAGVYGGGGALRRRCHKC